MAYLADSIWVNVSTSGTADFTTTTALAGYRTFADASTPNGSTIHYSARSATQFENGEGIYSSGTGIVTRATIFASSSAGAKVNFSGSPTLVVAPLAEDFGASSLTIGTTTITGGTTKHVLYDLAGEVEEAANFTIESGNPNVTAGNAYLFDGVHALKSTSSNTNWFFGNAGNLTASGAGNVGIGSSALNAITAGDANMVMGYQAGLLIQGGDQNVAIGTLALAANVSANGNVAIGDHALAATTGGGNTGIGPGAMAANVGGVSNVAIGTALNSNVSGGYNVGIGETALNANLGSANIGIGRLAGWTITTGENNTVIGYNAGGSVTTGGSNTIIGSNISGLSSGLANSIVIADGAGTIKLDYNKTTAGEITLNDDTDIVGTVKTSGYTIGGTLPAAGTAGRRAYVTNSAASPAFMATLTGGGSTIVPVFDDGTNWRYG